MVGSPVTVAKVVVKGRDVESQTELQTQLPCRACAKLGEEAKELRFRVDGHAAVQKSLRVELGGRVDALVSEVVRLVAEASECRQGVGEAMADCARRMHDRDEAVRMLTEERDRQVGEYERLKVEAETERKANSETRARERQAQAAQQREAELRVEEVARAAAEGERRVRELREKLEDKARAELLEVRKAEEERATAERAKERKAMAQFEASLDEVARARVGLEEARDQGLQLLHEVKEARGWTKASRRKIVQQIGDIYGVDMAEWIDETNPTLNLEGRGAGKRTVPMGVEELVVLREGQAEGGMSVDVLVSLMRGVVASLSSSLSQWEADLTHVLLDFERFVLERGHADGVLEGETAFSAWRKEGAFKASRTIHRPDAVLLTHSPHGDRVAGLLREGGQRKTSWGSIWESDREALAAEATSAKQGKRGVSIVNLQEHPVARSMRMEDELDEARRRIAELVAEMELLGRKRQDYVREGMIKQAKLTQAKEEEAYKASKAEKKARTEDWDAKRRRHQTPTPLHGSPEPKIVAGAEKMPQRGAATMLVEQGKLSKAERFARMEAAELQMRVRADCACEARCGPDSLWWFMLVARDDDDDDNDDNDDDSFMCVAREGTGAQPPQITRLLHLELQQAFACPPKTPHPESPPPLPKVEHALETAKARDRQGKYLVAHIESQRNAEPGRSGALSAPPLPADVWGLQDMTMAHVRLLEGNANGGRAGRDSGEFIILDSAGNQGETASLEQARRPRGWHGRSSPLALKNLCFAGGA